MQKKSILIIDDNRDFLDLLLLTLKSEYDCHGFAKLGDVLNTKNHNVVYDLVISDYNLEGAKAPDLISDLKKKRIINNQPVLLISGYIGDALTSTNLNITYFLEKPFKMKELRGKLNDIFEHQLNY